MNNGTATKKAVLRVGVHPNMLARLSAALAIPALYDKAMQRPTYVAVGELLPLAALAATAANTPTPNSAAVLLEELVAHAQRLGGRVVGFVPDDSVFDGYATLDLAEAIHNTTT